MSKINRQAEADESGAATPADKPVIAMTVTHLWAAGAATIAMLSIAFGLGVFVEQTSSERALFVKSIEGAKQDKRIRQLANELSDAEDRLALARSANQGLETKAKLLARLASYLEAPDDTSRKQLTEVVCAVWKQSKEGKIAIQLGRLELPFNLHAISPSLRDLLLSKGISVAEFDAVRQPDTARVPVSLFQFFDPKPSQAQKQRGNAVQKIHRIAQSTEVPKLVKFGDEPAYQLPQEIGIAVYMTTDCVPS